MVLPEFKNGPREARLLAQGNVKVDNVPLFSPPHMSWESLAMVMFRCED